MTALETTPAMRAYKLRHATAGGAGQVPGARFLPVQLAAADPERPAAAADFFEVIMARGRKRKTTTEAGDAVAAEEARQEQREAKGSNSRKGEAEIQAAHESLNRLEGVLETARGKVRQRPRMSPHGTRHTWASWYYATTKDPMKLMREGGWRSLDLVERYAHLMPSHLVPAIAGIWGVADPAQFPAAAPRGGADQVQPARAPANRRARSTP